MVQMDGLIKFLFRESSSESMRIEGVQVSSNWPDLTAQTKAPRNASARNKLMKINKKMTSIINWR